MEQNSDTLKLIDSIMEKSIKLTEQTIKSKESNFRNLLKSLDKWLTAKTT